MRHRITKRWLDTVTADEYRAGKRSRLRLVEVAEGSEEAMQALAKLLGFTGGRMSGDDRGWVNEWIHEERVYELEPAYSSPLSSLAIREIIAEGIANERRILATAPSSEASINAKHDQEWTRRQQCKNW